MRGFSKESDALAQAICTAAESSSGFLSSAVRRDCVSSYSCNEVCAAAVPSMQSMSWNFTMGYVKATTVREHFNYLKIFTTPPFSILFFSYAPNSSDKCLIYMVSVELQGTRGKRKIQYEKIMNKPIKV